VAVRGSATSMGPKWLKSQPHLKGLVASWAMYDSIVAMLNIRNTLIPCVASRNFVETLPLLFLCQSVLPHVCSGLPKSSSLTHLMEHRDGPNGATTHLEDGN
jgi:hypothetical protein